MPGASCREKQLYYSAAVEVLALVGMTPCPGRMKETRWMTKHRFYGACLWCFR